MWWLGMAAITFQVEVGSGWPAHMIPTHPTRFSFPTSPQIHQLFSNVSIMSRTIICRTILILCCVRSVDSESKLHTIRGVDPAQHPSETGKRTLSGLINIPWDCAICRFCNMGFLRFSNSTRWILNGRVVQPAHPPIRNSVMWGGWANQRAVPTSSIWVRQSFRTTQVWKTTDARRPSIVPYPPDSHPWVADRTPMEYQYRVASRGRGGPSVGSR